MDSVEFFVPGIASPGGSKTGYMNKNTGKFVIVPASEKTKPWMDTVRWIAGIECKRMCLWTGPLLLTLVFYRTRPKGHFGTGRNAGKLKPKYASPFVTEDTIPVQMPDLTKLIRATEDGLTGVIWKDDSQVVAQQTFKLYADPPNKPGVLIRVEQLADVRLSDMVLVEPGTLFEQVRRREDGEEENKTDRAYSRDTA